MINRRSVVRLGTAAAAVSLMNRYSSPIFAAAASHHIDFGLQLYTLQRQIKADLPGTLRAVAAAGFRSVELPGFFGFPPRLLVDAIRSAGLRCDTCHVWPKPDRGDPDLDGAVPRTADLLRSLGLSHMVMPFVRLPARLAPRGPHEAFTPFLRRIVDRLKADDWVANAEWMNARAAAFRRCGMSFSYHNHNLEFATVGSASGMELLLAKTDPALVSFELDAGWCAAAGVDPAALLRRHRGRFPMMHVKNIGRATLANDVGVQDSAALDTGVIDWRRLLPVAVACGVRCFYVEQEASETREPTVEDVTRSVHFLASIGQRAT